jgi:hypothetical protein
VALNHLWIVLTVLNVAACRFMKTTLGMFNAIMQVLLMDRRAGR